MNSSTCRVGTEQLLGYLDDPSAQPGLSEHISICSFCQMRLLAMAGGARTRGSDRTECQKVLREIPALMAAEASDEATAERFGPVRLHLLLCHDCFEAYRELRQMTEAILDDTLPLVPASVYHPPDLSFLHSDRTASRVSILPTLRLNLMLLFQPRQLAPMPVRDEKDIVTAEISPAGPTYERTWGAEELGALTVEVKLHPDLADATQMRLQVEAHHIARFDAAGMRVVLRLAEGAEVVRHTDMMGMVEFEGSTEESVRTAVLEITPTPSDDLPPG